LGVHSTVAVSPSSRSAPGSVSAPAEGEADAEGDAEAEADALSDGLGAFVLGAVPLHPITDMAMTAPVTDAASTDPARCMGTSCRTLLQIAQQDAPCKVYEVVTARR